MCNFHLHCIFIEFSAKTGHNLYMYAVRWNDLNVKTDREERREQEMKKWKKKNQQQQHLKRKTRNMNDDEMMG